MPNSSLSTGLQLASLLCPPLYPQICSDFCPLSQWCYLTALCRPLLLLPSIFPSIRVFSNELALCIRWPDYWSFSFSVSPANEYSGLISFRTDWFVSLLSRRLSKSLLQHHNSKTSILQHSAFFMVQLLHPYMTTGKTIGWTIQTWDITIALPLLEKWCLCFLICCLGWS